MNSDTPQTASPQVRSLASPQAQGVLRNTYMLLSGLLGISAISALISMAIGVGHFSVLIMLPGFYLLLWLVSKNRNSGKGLIFAALFSAFLGVSMGPLMGFMLGSASGAKAALSALTMTSFAFFALSAFAIKQKANLQFLSAFIITGFVALIVGMISQIFLKMPGLHLAISCGFVLFSSAIIVYQTQSIVSGGQDNYIMAAVDLFVSLFNMFVSLLNLFTFFRD